MVDKFVANKRYCYAVKGIAGTGRDVIEDQNKRRQRLRKKRKKSSVVEPVGVDQAKALLYSRLKIKIPGPGYIHFPNTISFDEEFFKQITAEKLVTKYNKGRPYQEWVPMRPRNEALDCYNYALAALRLSRLNPAKELQRKLKEQTKPKIKKKAARNNQFQAGVSLL